MALPSSFWASKSESNTKLNTAIVNRLTKITAARQEKVAAAVVVMCCNCTAGKNPQELQFWRGSDLVIFQEPQHILCFTLKEMLRMPSWNVFAVPECVFSGYSKLLHLYKIIQLVILKLWFCIYFVLQPQLLGPAPNPATKNQIKQVQK